MNRSKRFLTLAVAILTLAPASAFAYNILSLDMGGYWNDLQNQFVDAQPGYGVSGATGERWYTTVTPTQLATVNLLDYDVMLVQSAFLDDYVLYEATDALNALFAKRDDIASFVSGGHGLVAWAEPMPDNVLRTWDWAPVALQSIGVEHEAMVDIFDPSHPIVQHSTNQSLSGWTSSWHGSFTQWDPRLQMIVRTGDYGPTDPRTHLPLTLAGAYNAGGCGRMVFSMQDPDYHAYQQAPNVDDAATFITDALDWANYSCQQPIPEPGSISLLGLGLSGILVRRLSRRRGRREPSSNA